MSHNNNPQTITNSKINSYTISQTMINSIINNNAKPSKEKIAKMRKIIELDTPFILCEKLVGTYCYIANQDNIKSIRGRNNNKYYPKCYNDILDNIQFPNGYALKGTVIGNHEGTDSYYDVVKPTFYCITVTSLHTGLNLNLEDTISFCKDNNILFVPIIQSTMKFSEYKNLAHYNTSINDFVYMSVGKSLINLDKERKGVICMNLAGEELVSWQSAEYLKADKSFQEHVNSYLAALCVKSERIEKQMYKDSLNMSIDKFNLE